MGGSIPPRAGPRKPDASSSLSLPWPAKPGARKEGKPSSNPFSASLAAALGRIRSQPKRKNLGRKAGLLCVCVCVCSRLGVLSP